MLHVINYSPYIVHKKNLTSKEANIRLKMNNEKENKKKEKKEQGREESLCYRLKSIRVA